MGRDLAPGRLIDNRFRLTDVILRGQATVVYEAIDYRTGRTVAIKVPHLELESHPGFHSRFEREASLGRHFRDSHVVPVIECLEKSRPYIALEMPEGEFLRTALERECPLEIDNALRTAGGILLALAAIHERGVIHRDLTPENLLMCEDGRVLLCDLGSARIDRMVVPVEFQKSRWRQSSAFSAPEIVAGLPGDARSDLYSLGVILYLSLTGFLPFQGSDPVTLLQSRRFGDPRAPRALNPALSPEVEEFLLHSLERNPEDRYPTAREMHQVLGRIGGLDVTGRAGRLRPPRPWRIWAYRLRGLTWALCYFLGFSIIGVLAVASKITKPDGRTSRGASNWRHSATTEARPARLKEFQSR